MTKSFVAKFRFFGDGREAEVSNETGLLCEDKSLAQQSLKDETDINNIVESFIRTRDPMLLVRDGKSPQYGDFFGIPNDYHSALNTVIVAREAFDSLSAKVRARFSNDPGMFVDFCSDPANRAEALELGLIKDSVVLDEPARAPSALAQALVDADVVPTPTPVKSSPKGKEGV